ncbi:hypothetical protein [Candidatus Epulonipiscium viviparus]|uniref:hypothetical protein n=1 Tax=Candidatus Epulonipiscium viviparus TaxID=420336 RepID=UPI002738046C|nr:hypothetical protein [Candidatus Epulopiscium viviparus]
MEFLTKNEALLKFDVKAIENALILKIFRIKFLKLSLTVHADVAKELAKVAPTIETVAATPIAMDNVGGAIIRKALYIEKPL